MRTGWKHLFSAAAAASFFFAPQAALAITYDAFASFNGTNGAGGFFYFAPTKANPQSPADTTPLVGSSDCPLDTVCLRSTNDATDAAVFKATALTPDNFSDGSETISIPHDALILQPSDFGVGVLFIAPSAGTYHVELSLNSLSDLADGAILAFIVGPNVSTQAETVFDNSLFVDNLILSANDRVGFALRPGTAADYDLTGFNFTLSAEAVSGVPEASSWAMMLIGFGAVGAAMRRRHVVRASVRFS